MQAKAGIQVLVYSGFRSIVGMTMNDFFSVSQDN